jgi:hypothetical protein
MASSTHPLCPLSLDVHTGGEERIDKVSAEDYE